MIISHPHNVGCLASAIKVIIGTNLRVAPIFLKKLLDIGGLTLLVCAVDLGFQFFDIQLLLGQTLCHAKWNKPIHSAKFIFKLILSWGRRSHRHSPAGPLLSASNSIPSCTFTKQSET